ncbi:hypothetical protein F5I97DRAFT_1816109 [Phlebopus sp. FC_14]|nr:hypothetical protein F5I97DRAFT_1816109 [Phlebopus sp. FC_14]
MMLPLRVTTPMRDHFRRNYQQHLLANDLQTRAKRMMSCFAGDALPMPNDEINAAWSQLPNDSIDMMPMCLKTGQIFLRAPPPTPTDSSTATDDSSLSSESCSRTRSDTDSPGSSQQESPTPTIKFQEMVENGIADYRARGAGPLVETLIIAGVETIQSAIWVSMSANAIVKKVTKSSGTEGKNLEKAVRVAAMEMFRQHWQPVNWFAVCSTSSQHSAMTLRGVNKAGFMGSLFTARVATAEDIALCLSLLLEGEKHFDRLCAMHAVLVQANDKLCKNRNLAALMHFKETVTSKDELGEYLWAQTAHARTILKDILDTIEGWVATQTLKRVRNRASTMSRVFSKKAVGPRLRTGERD